MRFLQLLDPEKVGQLMQEREGGVFINEHYCVTSGYEPPDINIEIGKPERFVFSGFWSLVITQKRNKRIG